MRRLLIVPTLAAVPLALLPGGAASAHGTMQNPVSRGLACYKGDSGNPEHPKNKACRAAVKAGGTQAFYDWNGVNIADAAGRHRKLIPDGKLCSAGRAEFAGLDLPRADWPATKLRSGAKYTFRFRGTAPHRGTFSLFVTRNSYRPTRALKWTDLQPKPILRTRDPRLVDGVYVFPAIRLPKKTGRHLIYAIWQRSDSPEAFYSCSDVVFGGGAARERTAPALSPQGHSHPVEAAPVQAAPVRAVRVVPASASGPEGSTAPWLLPSLAAGVLVIGGTAAGFRRAGTGRRRASGG